MTAAQILDDARRALHGNTPDTTVMANCPRCKRAWRARLPENCAQSAAAFVLAVNARGIYFVANYDPVCTGCDRGVRMETLRATHNPEKTCGAACLNARRPQCDCSCNGEQHGAGWEVA